MKASAICTAVLACGVVITGGASAQGVKNGNATVICEYSHTLADDPIVYPGKPGVAMWHDFLGNTTANAHSTPDSVHAENDTTCENAADTTAYWAPALKLPDGTVVPPKYQKTYYTNQALPSERHVRVQSFPLDNVLQYRSFTVTNAINEAIAAGKDAIAFCIRGDGAGIIWTFGSRDTDNPPLQLLMSLSPLPY